MPSKYRNRLKNLDKKQAAFLPPSLLGTKEFALLYDQALSQGKFLDFETGEFLTREQLKERFPRRYERVTRAEKHLGVSFFSLHEIK